MTDDVMMLQTDESIKRKSNLTFLKQPPDFNIYLYRSQKMRPKGATFQKRQTDPEKNTTHWWRQ